MIVSSFFPGRIRLRDEVLEDEDIAAALKSAVEAHKSVKHVEYNTRTGSALIEYDPAELPIQKFKILKDEIYALQKLCDFYTEAKKTEVLKAIKSLAEKLNG